MKRTRAGLLLVGLLLVAGCSRRGKAGGSGFSLFSGASYEVGTPVLVTIEGDAPVHVVHAPSATRGAIVYLHGRCTEVATDLARIAGVASTQGTIIAPQGDEACPGGHGFRWTTDIQAIEPRIERALQAVAAARGGALDTDAITLIGYSEGAARTESLAHAFPARYPRVALIGAPNAPSAANLGAARSVALIAGQKDRQDLMKTGLLALEHAGKPARFFELPGAEHGEFGPDGVRVMDEALAFLAQH
jgi:predicted esterase